MITEAQLRGFADFLDVNLGLHFSRSRWPELERGLAAAAVELSFSTPEECAQWFVDGQGVQGQLEVLATHLTIGETYFFRDAPAFDLLATEVLPQLIRSRRGVDQRLRLWSAACCTGEEAYSLAITVSRLLPDAAEWQVTILATDVNPRFLQKAHAGSYGGWSFRSESEDLKDRYFTQPQPDRWSVRPEVRRLVNFGLLNLAADVYPSLANGTNAMDVILCRNVLMYFSRDQTRRVTRKLRRALVPGGWLFTSASEAVRDLFEDFTPVHQQGALAFRKTDQVFGHCLETPPAPSGRLPEAARPLPAAGLPAGISLPEGSNAAAIEARRLADEGKLGEALAVCENGLQKDKLVAANHYLHGIILLEQGALDSAASALRTALYLDQSLVVAHFALGSLLRQRGREKEAARSFANSRVLLQRLAPDSVLPESDGITAGRLLAMLDSVQEIGAQGQFPP